MKLISEVSSLIKFQKRVLEKGTPATSRYSAKELKDLFSFDSIFLSNTDEMFEKYDCKEIASEYVNLLHIYIKNIGFILKSLMRLDTGCDFTYESSIEKRITEATSFGNRYHWDYARRDASFIKTLPNGIYYIAQGSHNDIVILTFDKSVYETLYSYDDICWKTDDCIMEYLNNSDIHNRVSSDFIEIKVSSYDSKTNKIEYYGNPELMKYYIQYLPNGCVVVQNPFLFINDIKLMIDRFFVRDNTITKPNINYDNVLRTLRKDELIEYPVDSFKDYLNFLQSSVNNPDTKAIYVTLYRIGKNPAIFNILQEAVDRDIDVNVNIELCASGEWINNVWKEEMESAGMNVTTFKCGTMKVHSKLSLVEFKNGTCVAQIGTGNYHTETTRQYTDLSLMTSDPEICNCIKSVFEMFNDDTLACDINDDFIVTGVENTNISLILDLIDEQASYGHSGLICFKCNSLSDKTVIEHLDHAAKKGCMIDLIVRGICTWIPEYQNVRVRSIVWDKLEHSRVYSFGRVNPTIYLGSLDLMTRKIKRRIETLVRAKDPVIVAKLCKYLNRYITEESNTWIMQNDGTYIREVE